LCFDESYATAPVEHDKQGGFAWCLVHAQIFPRHVIEALGIQQADQMSADQLATLARHHSHATVMFMGRWTMNLHAQNLACQCTGPALMAQHNRQPCGVDSIPSQNQLHWVSFQFSAQVEE
jgi:hypothetical protein